jgi:outer membrane autotransporter protein
MKSGHISARPALKDSHRLVRNRRAARLLKSTSIAALMLIAPGAIAQTVISSSQALPAGNHAGIVVNNGAVVTGTNVNSAATGATTPGIDAAANSSVTLNGSVITTAGNNNAYGVYARTGADVSLTGGSVTTLTTRGQSDLTEGLARGYGLYANGAGSSVSADGTTIQTYGARSYGAHALAGGSVTLNNVSITTAGGFGYGVYASGAGSVLTATDITVSTSGFTGDAIWAYAGGLVNIDGGTFTIGGGPNPNVPHETANGITAVGGTNGSGNGVVNANRIVIDTYGENSHGILAGGDVGSAQTSGAVTLTNSTITTHGSNGTAAASIYGSTLNVSDSTLNAMQGVGVKTGSAGSTVTLTNTTLIAGASANGYGVEANTGATVTINGGSVTTQSTRGQNDLTQGAARGYALYASDAGTSITANGTTLQTYGLRSYGAHALNGGAITLNDVTIRTEGALGYGIYASGANSVINATNLNVTTNGFTGDAVWAFNGGHVTINGGTLTANGGPNPNAPGEATNGMRALGGGYQGTGTAGIIDASNLTINTFGLNSDGVVVGGDIGTDQTYGTVNLANSNVTVRGTEANAARILYGSTFNATGGTLASTNGAAIHIGDSATVNLTGTTVTAGKESIVSQLNTAGSVQTITIGAGTVMNANNGTLLQVNRGEAGGDGQVNLTLGAGSTSRGDIRDEGAKTAGGYTDVFVSSEASWTGVVKGVRNFTTDAGGSVAFEGKADVQGDLAGNNTDYSFSQEGGTISGNVELASGSTTTGGSIATPIVVVGNVDVDVTSVFGGNWQIQGNVVNQGTTTPGNSIGLIDVGGNYTFGAASVYAVEVNLAGQADLVRVGGIATLDGRVTVTPMDGALLNAPYTIVSAGSIVGTFDGVSLTSAAAFPFLAVSLGYTPTRAFVTIVRSGLTYASLGTTPNQIAVGGALDSLALNGSLAQALGAGSVAGALVAFDQLSGEVHASLRTGLFEDSRHVRNAALARAIAPLGADRRLSVWGNAYGSWGESATRRFTQVDRKTRGIVAGIDAGLGGTGRIGILGGYSRSDYDVDQRASSADVESYQAGIYAGSSFGGFSVAAGGIYTWHKIDTDRAVGFGGFTDALSARYDGNTAQAFGDIGYAVPFGGAQVGPFVSAAYVRVKTDAVTETGGAAALSIAKRNSDVVFSTVGLRAAIGAPDGVAGLRGHGMIGWRHAFNDRAPTIRAGFAGGSQFVTGGIPISKETAVLDLGLETDVAPGMSIGASYSGQIGGGSSDNGLKANFRISF